MKFSQADENVLTTLFGKEVVDKLSGALKSDDGELSLGARINGRVITTEDERLLKESSVQQGKEIGYKDIAKGLNIDLSAGEKDPAIIASKLTNSITASLEDKYKNPQPGEREKELETKLNDATAKYDTLFGTHNETLKLVDEKENAYTGLKKEIKVKERNNNILKAFPEKMTQDRNDALIIMANTFEFDEQDGKSVIKRNGEIVRDGAGNAETYENVIKSFVEEKKWIKSNGMNGGDRNNGNTKTGLTPEAAEKAIIESGIDPGSPEGLKTFNEMTKQ
jgi:hypothetical protein